MKMTVLAVVVAGVLALQNPPAQGESRSDFMRGFLEEFHFGVVCLVCSHYQPRVCS